MIRPALTNYFEYSRQTARFCRWIEFNFTSMGNFIGPLVAGALFDVNLEFPLYMAIAVSLSGIIIIFIEKDLSHAVKKQINTGPNKENFAEKFYGQSKFWGRGGTQCSRRILCPTSLFYNL